jgi:hypothetical protein
MTAPDADPETGDETEGGPGWRQDEFGDGDVENWRSERGGRRTAGPREGEEK